MTLFRPRFVGSMITLLIVLTSFAANAVVRDVRCEGVPQPKAYAAKFVAIQAAINSGFDKKLPFVDNLVGPIFRDHYDWHSSVEAHWADALIARLNSDAALDSFIEARLNHSALLATAAALRKDHGFELPYGRAWFVLMLDEIQRNEHHRTDVAFLHSLQRAIALQVLTENESSNDNGGLHGSWIFSAFLLGRTKSLDSDVRARLSADILKRHARLNQLIQHDNVVEGDFFDPASLAGVLTDQLSSFNVSQAEFTTFAKHVHDTQSHMAPFEGHASGFFLTRLWPEAVDSANGNQSRCEQFISSFDQFFIDTRLWTYDFQAQRHWLPQFMTMTIWLSLNEP
jgi:hypothetical protein